MLPKRLLAFLTFTLILSDSAFGQTHQFTDVPSCGSCRLQLNTLAKLGQEDGPGSMSGMLQSIVRDRSGRYWVATDGDLPLVFDSLGRYLATIGKRGSGPGEYISPRLLILVPGDSV